jgi:hypothetical protein
MERGVCKLCQNEEDLLDCHLISAAVSKLLRARQNTNPNPLVVTADWIGQTSEQVSAYEFCRKCEDIFNERGEKWILPQLASLDGFPLYDMLLKAKPFFQQEELSAYHACDITDFEKVKVIHFAMAIFWKASVRDWGTKGKTIYVGLGRYAEPLRQFVLGTGPFPKNMYLAVTILPPTVPLLGMLMPVRMVQKTFHRYKFYVPGLEFELKVGKQVPAEWREQCLATGPLELVSCSPAFAYTMGKNYVDARRSARISAGFTKFLKERGEEGIGASA